MAVLGFRQNDAGGKRAKGKRQAGPAGNRRGANHDEQRGRGEDFAGSRPADGSEDGPQQETAAKKNDRDGSRRFEERDPDRPVGMLAGQRRHEGDLRNRRQILEEQNGETIPPGGQRQQVALGEERQHDCR